MSWLGNILSTPGMQNAIQQAAQQQPQQAAPVPQAPVQPQVAQAPQQAPQLDLTQLQSLFANRFGQGPGSSLAQLGQQFQQPAAAQYSAPQNSFLGNAMQSMAQAPGNLQGAGLGLSTAQQTPNYSPLSSLAGYFRPNV